MENSHQIETNENFLCNFLHDRDSTIQTMLIEQAANPRAAIQRQILTMTHEIKNPSPLYNEKPEEIHEGTRMTNWVGATVQAKCFKHRPNKLDIEGTPIITKSHSTLKSNIIQCSKTIYQKTDENTELFRDKAFDPQYDMFLMLQVHCYAFGLELPDHHGACRLGYIKTYWDIDLIFNVGNAFSFVRSSRLVHLCSTTRHQSLCLRMINPEIQSYSLRTETARLQRTTDHFMSLWAPLCIRYTAKIANNDTHRHHSLLLPMQ